MTEHFDLSRIRTAVEAVIEREGADYRYAPVDNFGGCSYTKPHPEERDPAKTCGCLIGEALMLEGVSREALSSRDLTYVGPGGLSARGIIHATEEAAQWACDVQNAQDKGFTWGEAFAEAEAELAARYS